MMKMKSGSTVSVNLNEEQYGDKLRKATLSPPASQKESSSMKVYQ